MDRLTTTTRLLENSRSTIYTSGHSTEKGIRELLSHPYTFSFTLITCDNSLTGCKPMNYAQRETVSQLPDKREHLWAQTSSNWLSSICFVAAIEDEKIECSSVFTLRTQQSKHACLSCCMTKVNLTTAQIILCRLISLGSYVNLGRGCCCVTVY